MRGTGDRAIGRSVPYDDVNLGLAIAFTKRDAMWPDKVLTQSGKASTAVAGDGVELVLGLSVADVRFACLRPLNDVSEQAWVLDCTGHV